MTDLTTTAAVKQYIGKTDSIDDDLFATLVTAYSQWVRSWTNRDFDVRSYNIWRSGRGGVSLILPQWPLVSIDSLTINGQTIAAQASWGDYGFRFSDRAINLDGGCRFWFGSNNINIGFTAGYATIPADIAQAVNELVALRYKLRDKLEWSSKTLAGEVVSLVTKDMPSSVATVLKQYQNVVPL